MVDIDLNLALEEDEIYRQLILILEHLINIFKIVDSKEEKDRKIGRLFIHIDRFLNVKDVNFDNIFREKIFEIRDSLENNRSLYNIINSLDKFLEEQKIIDLFIRIVNKKSL